jgi:hypothetical protein
MKKATTNRSAGGRPPKFNEVRRPVTVTLPQRILDLLAAVDEDRARAIARVTETAVGTDRPEYRQIELIEIGPEQCVVVVNQSEHLRKIPWLKLVEIAPARNLLIIPLGTPIETLEVSLSDLIENIPADARERAILIELRFLINRLRRAEKITKGEIIFFATKPTVRQASPPSA